MKFLKTKNLQKKNRCKKDVVIVIPVYQKTPEAPAIKRVLEVLDEYDLCFIAPKSLDTKEYEALLEAKSKQYSIQRFDDKYFKNVRSYSKLCLESKLYRAFEDYNYIFLFQEDGWVFKNELKDWCEKGFDYIGAPWFEGFEKADKTSSMVEFSGNGGVSLRKVSSFINILKKEGSFINRLKAEPIRTLANLIVKTRFKTEFQKLKERTNEDAVICGYLKDRYSLKIAPNREAVFFSFETMPKRLYELTEGVLPFACHGYKKYDPEFWKEFIPKENF